MDFNISSICNPEPIVNPQYPMPLLE